MHCLKNVLELIQIVTGKMGPKPDFVIVKQGNCLFMTCLNGNKYGFRVKVWDLNETVGFQVSQATTLRMQWEKPISGITLLGDLKGDKTVIIDVEPCRNPAYNEIVVRIPGGRTAKIISLDERDDVMEPRTHPLEALFGSMSGIGQPRVFQGGTDGIISILGGQPIPGMHEMLAEFLQRGGPARRPERHAHPTNGDNFAASASNGNGSIH